MEMYAIMNIKDGGFLDYASKRKKIFSKGYVGHTVESPFPTLRPIEHIEKNFKKWINNTIYPEDYKIVKFVLSGVNEVKKYE